jgi:hypothetical protein
MTTTPTVSPDDVLHVEQALGWLRSMLAGLEATRGEAG